MLLVDQATLDTQPETFWERCHRIPKARSNVAECIEFNPTAGALLQVPRDDPTLVTYDGVECIGAEQLTDLPMGQHASTPWIPASTNVARIRRMPLRILLLTVPSGCLTNCGNLEVGVTLEIRQLYHSAFFLREFAHGAGHLVGQ